MTKYVLINGKNREVLNEEELVNFSFNKLTNSLSSNILKEYSDLEKNILFSNYGNYFKTRSQIIQKCYEDGCINPPIYSHSISRNAVLKNIALKGEVYTPRVAANCVIMKKVGIETQASVFPGFCSIHDTNLFSELDKSNILNYSSLFFDQLTYRTIIREIYSLNRNIRFSDIMIKDLQLGFKTAKQNVLNRYNNSFISSKYIISDFNSDEYSLNNRIETIKDIQSRDLNILSSLIDFYQNQSPYFVTFAKINYTLPVAFSGFTNFLSNKKSIHLLINCLPYKKHTLFSYVTSKRNNEILKNELLADYDLEDSNSLLNFIELLSVKGTDNIFFDINYWNRLNKSTTNKFIKDFSNFASSDPREKINYSFLKWNYDK